MRKLTVGSLFAGIGGFDLGLQRAGIQTVWQVEIDPACRAVLRRHWPGVRQHEDVRHVNAATEPVRPEVLCGGFPCQDLSVAGRRAGLAGARSGLFFEFMRIVGEFAPRWVLVENVPGLLSSSRGRDMGAVLGTLGQLGYGTAYRVLDAQYFGVPQRRRRVFIVGHSGNQWQRAAEVLFEREILPWDTPPCREAGAEAAGSISASAGSDGLGGVGCSRSSITRRIVNCLDRQMGAGGPNDNSAQAGHLIDVVTACNAHGGTGRSDFESETFIFQRRIGRNDRGQPEDVCPALSGANAGATSDMRPCVHAGMAVRRLTPRECERLQGFPDDWTRQRDDGRELADCPRYRMLGNAVCVPVAQWIGERIFLMEKDYEA